MTGWKGRLGDRGKAMIGLVAIPLLLPAVGGADGPDVGAPAPDFSLTGSDGKVYTLDQFHGERAVVLAWFPKAFTPG